MRQLRNTELLPETISELEQVPTRHNQCRRIGLLIPTASRDGTACLSSILSRPVSCAISRKTVTQALQWRQVFVVLLYKSHTSWNWSRLGDRHTRPPKRVVRIQQHLIIRSLEFRQLHHTNCYFRDAGIALAQEAIRRKPRCSVAGSTILSEPHIDSIVILCHITNEINHKYK